jgi:tetratricopeptide (TPR) repeat protein
VGYHAVNVLLHSLAAVLLWRVLARLQVPGAWLAAAIFGLHPVMVESVAWLTERKNVLSAVFYLAAVLACLRSNVWSFSPEENNAARTGTPGPRPAVSFRWYSIALVLFLCALWSKTVVCSLPAAWLLVIWWKKGRIVWRDIGFSLPFFVIGLAFALLTAWLEKHHVGAQGSFWQQTFLERCLIAGRVPWFYAGKLFWPVPLMMVYPRWIISTAIWWQWLFPLALLVLGLTLWFLRTRIGRGPLVAALFFVGTLTPALGFFNVYPMRFSFVADHFQYLASVGLIALAVAAVTRLPRTARQAVPFLLLPLAILTWRHVEVFQNLETLWTDTLAKNPACAIAHNNLGVLLAARGESAGGEAHYRESLRLEPQGEEPLSNLAVILAERGQFDEAMELLDRALRIAPKNAEIRDNLGKVLVARGQSADAIESFELAIQLKPQRPEFYYDLGSVLVKAGRNDEAISQFQQALVRRPDYADAYNNLGLALARESRYAEAVQQYAMALQIKPDHALAHNNLGDALMRLRDVDQAVTHFTEALRLNPDYANAHFNLGNALALQRRYAEAADQFGEALRLSPNYILAHRNLGLALERLGRHEEAIGQFKEALRLDPGNEEFKQRLQALETQLPQ